MKRFMEEMNLDFSFNRGEIHGLLEGAGMTLQAQGVVRVND